jgi:hypothetical protein
MKYRFLIQKHDGKRTRKKVVFAIGVDTEDAREAIERDYPKWTVVMFWPV